MLSRTWPVAPDKDTLNRRWAKFVSSGDLKERAAMYVTPNNGRSIYTQVGSRPTLASLPVGTPPSSIVRYAIRSFDRQWTFDDPRLAKTESPALWASVGPGQVFLTTLTTARIAAPRPAATAATAVPDKHHFDSRGGKDVIPLYRDAHGTPNVAPGWVDVITTAHRANEPNALEVTPERLFAYAYGVLAGTDYTTRFSEALATPGPRIPLTADPALFARMTDHGDHLLWLQTFGERTTDTHNGRLPRPAGLSWTAPVGQLPATPDNITYGRTTHELHIGDGVLAGVRPDVWDLRIGTLEPVARWLHQRTRKGSGRAVTHPGPLDPIRPTAWSDAWNDDLLDLIRCLTASLDLAAAGAGLLDQIASGPTLDASELPAVPATARVAPAVPRQ